MADRVALGLEKKQDPGSLQGPGPDHAAPRSPPQPPSSTTDSEHTTPNPRVAEGTAFGCRQVRRPGRFCCYPTRPAERFWPPELTGVPSGLPPSIRSAPGSQLSAHGRLAQIAPDQLAALERLPAAFVTSRSLRPTPYATGTTASGVGRTSRENGHPRGVPRQAPQSLPCVALLGHAAMSSESWR
jgi:hypothetical protein